MIEHASKLAVLLAVVFVAAVPAGAADMLWTFEDPPYVLGVIGGQDGWYAEDSPPIQPTPEVTNVAPLEGNQSMLISTLAEDPYQRVWHSTAGQTITELMSYQFLARVEAGIVETGLWDVPAKQFWGIHLNVDENHFRFVYGWDCQTALDVEDCRAGNTYRILATLNFDNHTIRTIAQKHTGIRIMGGAVGAGYAGPEPSVENGARESAEGDPEIRIDEIGFNLTPVFLPGTLAGHVELQDFVGSKSLVPIRIELIPQGEIGYALTKIINLDSNNDYVLNNVDVGIYDIAFTGCGWLRTVVTGVEVTSENTTQCDVSLPNGDLDGDDEVTTTDLSVVLVNIN